MARSSSSTEGRFLVSTVARAVPSGRVVTIRATHAPDAGAARTT